MRIVIINNLYEPYARGGAERLVKLQAEELQRQGHEVRVLASCPVWGRKKEAGGTVPVTFMLVWNICSYYHLNRLPLPLRLVWHAIDMVNVQSYYAVWRLVRRHKPDTVITHNLKGIGFLAPRAIAHAGSSNHIHTLHDIQLLHPSGLMYVGRERAVDTAAARLYQWIAKRLFAGGRAVISPSQWLMDEHMKRGFFTASERVVIPNPVAIPPVKKTPATTKKPFQFVYVGQMERHKGVQLLLEAFARLREHGIPATLRLRGDGSLLAALQSQAKNVGGVEFVPWDSAAAAHDIAAADCLVMPSICYENYPTVVVEALALGTPVVASDIGGVKELIETGGGRLFSAGNVDSLVSVLTEVAQRAPGAFHPPQHSVQLDGRQYVEKVLQLC